MGELVLSFDDHLDRQPWCFVVASGDLDGAAAHHHAELIERYWPEFLGRRWPREVSMILDLSRVLSCDVDGLELLTAAHRALTRAGGQLVLVSPSLPVARRLRITGLAAWMWTYSTVPQAQAALAGCPPSSHRLQGHSADLLPPLAASQNDDAGKVPLRSADSTTKAAAY